MWADHIDPSQRDDALELVDDDRGFTWVSWRGRNLELADVHLPGNVKSNGDHRRDLRGGRRSSYVYDDALPDTYWSPTARVRWLDEVGFEEAVCFPNFPTSRGTSSAKAATSTWSCPPNTTGGRR